MRRSERNSLREFPPDGRSATSSRQVRVPRSMPASRRGRAGDGSLFASDVIHFRFQLFTRLFQHLHVAHQPADFGVVQDALGGLPTLFDLDGTLSDVFVQIRELAIELPDLKPQPEQLRLLKRTTR